MVTSTMRWVDSVALQAVGASRAARSASTSRGSNFASRSRGEFEPGTGCVGLGEQRRLREWLSRRARFRIGLGPHRVDQRERRRAKTPNAPRPSSPIAQAEVSGTGAKAPKLVKDSGTLETEFGSYQ
jgi:hypothetical protein